MRPGWRKSERDGELLKVGRTRWNGVGREETSWQVERVLSYSERDRTHQNGLGKMEIADVRLPISRKEQRTDTPINAPMDGLTEGPIDGHTYNVL